MDDVSIWDTKNASATVLGMTSVLAPPTADEVMATLTEWAKGYPSGRFVVALVDHDDTWSSAVLGWGVAYPDHIVYHLPEIKLEGTLASVDVLVTLLRRLGDVRLIWVDPEPERWSDDD
jgi:hypothetical protein